MCHRQQVTIDKRQPAAAAPVENDFIGQGVELGLVDDPETVQCHLPSRGEHSPRLVGDEKFSVRELAYKGCALHRLLVEIAAKGESVAHQLRRLPVLE